jgi:hypothetical protein
MQGKAALCVLGWNVNQTSSIASIFVWHILARANVFYLGVV